jgi:hypothetical protein
MDNRAAASVRVRGVTSINGTNEPLYVVDGIPISGDATGRSTSGRPIAGSDFLLLEVEVTMLFLLFHF